ncbi:MAG: FtsH protease activity modulator HflK, partial [Magnetospirillum sp. WYHS-4]
QGGGGGPRPPDIEAMLRRGQDRFKSILPGGLGAGRGFVVLLMAAVLMWLGSGVYQVKPGEEGVELLFGKFVQRTGPGLHVWLPEPFGEVLKPNVERTNVINIGFRGSQQDSSGRGAGSRDVPQESLMLTSDQAIIDADFVVQWRIKNAADFLFNIVNQEVTIKVVAESVMREVVGRAPLEGTLTQNRQVVEQHAKELMQKTLDDYGTGVMISDVKLQKVDPPTEVIDAFNDVQRALQDKERQQNEANAYRNDIIPKAKGEAERIIYEARGYKEKAIKDAEGEAKRFISVYDAYAQGKDVTARRLYLERMEDVFRHSQKVIVDQDGDSGGVVPYLPLPELKKREGAK